MTINFLMMRTERIREDMPTVWPYPRTHGVFVETSWIMRREVKHSRRHYGEERALWDFGHVWSEIGKL
jgi:hypothetical protein